MENKTKNIGLDVPYPEKTCTDAKCPFHGSLGIKPRTIVGKVVSSKMTNSAIIERETRKYIPKYERYIKQKSKIAVHNPPCIEAKDGDIVKVALTKPLSKKKNYVIVQILEKVN